MGPAAPPVQLVLEPAGEAADGLVGEPAAEDLFRQFGRPPGADAQEVGMPQDPVHIGDASLVAVEQKRSVQAALAASGDLHPQGAVGRAQLPQTMAVAIAAAGLAAPVPGGTEAELLFQFQDLLDEVHDEFLNGVLDPGPGSLLALGPCRGYTDIADHWVRPPFISWRSETGGPYPTFCAASWGFASARFARLREAP
jgi:hypothetical protein